MKKPLFIITSTIFLSSIACFAEQDTIAPKERELLIRIDERLNQMDKRFELLEQQIANLRADMNTRFEQVDKRFEQVDKRFEQVDKRFEQVDKRFEQVDKRFEQLDKRFELIIYLMISIVSAFAAIVAVTIGFAIWDRRSMIRPFEDKVKNIESDITEDRDKINRLIEAFRKLAQNDPKVAKILKSFSLL